MHNAAHARMQCQCSRSCSRFVWVAETDVHRIRRDAARRHKTVWLVPVSSSCTSGLSEAFQATPTGGPDYVLCRYDHDLYLSLRAIEKIRKELGDVQDSVDALEEQLKKEGKMKKAVVYGTESHLCDMCLGELDVLALDAQRMRRNPGLLLLLCYSCIAAQTEEEGTLSFEVDRKDYALVSVAPFPEEGASNLNLEELFARKPTPPDDPADE